MGKMTRIAMLLVAVLVALCMVLCGCFGGNDGSQTGSTENSQGGSQSDSSSANDSFSDDDSDFDDSEDSDETGGQTAEKIEVTGLGEVVSLSDEAVREYLTAATEAEQIEVLKKYSSLDLEKGGVPVRFSWKGNGSVRYTLYLADNENFDNATEYVASGLVNELDVYNLVPATTYYYKVEGTRSGDCSEVSHFKTDDVTVRFIRLDGGANARDLGGYKSINGSVNYGKIYRGSLSDGLGGLSEVGEKTLLNELKVKTEINLSGDAKQKSEYLDGKVGYYRFDVGSYTDILDLASHNALPASARREYDANKAKELKKLFGVLANKDNYPVIIRCENGADGTGTVAFLINALLGVGEGDLIKDFELSSFSKVSGARYRSSMNADKTAFDDSGVMQNDSEAFVAFGATINALKANYGMAGKSLSYAVENYLTGYVGVSSEEIESIKRIMLSDYTPSEIEYVDGERQVIEVSKSDNSVSLGEIAYSSVEGLFINNVDLGGSLSAIDGSDLADFYGERELTVIVNTENGQKIVKVPVLIVTKYVYTAEELKAALKVGAAGVYGYYELKNDITLDDFANDVGKNAFDGKNGFRGIFEGNGHTVTATLGNHGLFGYVSGGATIRNFKFVVNGEINAAGNTLIGDYIIGSNIENVTVEISANAAKFGDDGAGIISAEGFSGNTVNKFTVNAENAVINSLFGGGAAYAFDGNDFESCVIKVKDIKEIARNYANGGYVSEYLENIVGFGGEISDTVEISVADIINVNGSNIELGVGERFADGKIAAIDCNGKKITEYKFENGVLYLFNDREIFGENLGETTINITFEGINGISVKAKVSAVIFTNSEEVILSGTQEIVLSKAANAVNLGEYDGSTVYSIFLSGYYFGNDAESLSISDEFKANKIVHGNNTLTVLIGKDGKYYTLQIPVTVVTAEISGVEQFNEILKSDNAEYATYGYYKLTADIGNSKSEFNNGNDKNWFNIDGLYGFRGTLDGAGHSVTGTVMSKGLFGLVGKGAVIKDLTVNAYGYANGRTVLARSIRGAVVENVTINIKSGESDSYLTEGGIITALISHSTIYRNVEINSDGKTDTLFGCSYWSYDQSKANTFENVKVTVKSIGGLLCLRMNVAESLYAIDGVEGLTVVYVRSYSNDDNTVVVGSSAEFTIGSDNADVTEITSVTLDGRAIANFKFENGVLTIADGFSASDIGAKTLVLTGKVGSKSVTVYLGVTVALPAEEVTLDGEREIVLSSGTEHDLDLGEYSSATVLSATLGGENVTYANGKLTVTEDYIANVRKHGVQTLKVTVQKDGKYYNVIASVLVVTQDITTVEEFVTVSGKIYGYYRLANDILNTGDSINVSGSGDWKNVDGQSGFRGTFDGNGKTISGFTKTNGMFGIVGEGAVIKNFTYEATVHNAGGNVIARSITGATVEDVTINIKSIKGTLSASSEGGVITGLLSHTTLYKNVTINAEGIDLDTLFGMSYGNYKAEKANTFVGCTVNAKSLAGLVNSNGVVSAKDVDGLTLNTAE